MHPLQRKMFLSWLKAGKVPRRNCGHQKTRKLHVD
jgi:hypothetical protein